MIIKQNNNQDLQNRLLGTFIRKIRKEENHNGVLTAQCAGIKKSYLSALENGKAKIPKTIAEKIFDYFEIEFNDNFNLYHQVNEWLFVVYEYFLQDNDTQFEVEKKKYQEFRAQLENSYAFVYVPLLDILFSDSKMFNTQQMECVHNYVPLLDLKTQSLFYNLALTQKTSTQWVMKSISCPNELETKLLAVGLSNNAKGVAYVHLSEVYAHFKKYSEALDLLNEAERKFEMCLNTSKKLKCWLSKADMLIHMHSLRCAKIYLERAYPLLSANSNESLYCLDELIKLSLCLQDTSLARAYLSLPQASLLNCLSFYQLWLQLNGDSLYEINQTRKKGTLEFRILKHILNQETTQLEAQLSLFDGNKEYKNRDYTKYVLLCKCIATYYESRDVSKSLLYYKQISII